jgi:hypothetical protein
MPELSEGVDERALDARTADIDGHGYRHRCLYLGHSRT